MEKYGVESRVNLLKKELADLKTRISKLDKVASADKAAAAAEATRLEQRIRDVEEAMSRSDS